MTSWRLHRRNLSSEQLLFESPSGDGVGTGRRMQGEQGRRGMLQGGMSLSVDQPWLPSAPTTTARELVSSSQLTHGLLDLHSPDDEDPFYGLVDGSYASGYAHDNGYLNAFTVDKEKLANVAKIKVVVRKRPLNKKEMAKREEDIITTEPGTRALTVHERKLKVDLTEYIEKHFFQFDAVLDEDVSNDEVYRETVEPIIPAIFQRTKATCFAYGQTGSGKTYTMQPLPLKASNDILRMMNHTYRHQGFHLFFSFFEIYGGKIFDLLNDRRKLCMREDGKQQVCVVGLQEHKVSNVETIRELIQKGNGARSTGTTGANEESSRSHAILQLAIKKPGNESKPPRLVGKLSFIDLAGSERGADTTDNDKQTRIEGAEINKSLLALKECIRALDNDQVHVPFRGSKLTEVLRDSFIGDSRTVMISCISPSSGSCEHTLNTLRYADRVKSLSKAGNPRKDLSSVTVRESSASPFSSTLPSVSRPEDQTYVDRISNTREVKCMPIEPKSKNIPSTVSTVPEELNRPPKVFTLRGEISKAEDDVSKGATQQFWSSLPQEDDLLDDLLKEEEDLVAAHRKQLEEMLDIVREEMNLLAEAVEPGNLRDEYISRLSTILSQKVSGISDLQSRLAQFRRHLNQHNVLLSSPCP